MSEKGILAPGEVMESGEHVKTFPKREGVDAACRSRLFSPPPPPSAPVFT